MTKVKNVNFKLYCNWINETSKCTFNHKTAINLKNQVKLSQFQTESESLHYIKININLNNKFLHKYCSRYKSFSKILQFKGDNNNID